MSFHRNTFAVPAALGIVLILAGCTASSPADDSTATGQSPLTPYLSALFGAASDPNADSAALLEQEKKRQGVIAECMKEQGFDYVPYVDATAYSTVSADDWKPDDRSWVAQNGYGMLRSFEQTPETSEPDPNTKHLESLPESQQRAWNRALLGDYAGEEAPQEWIPARAGCSGKADQQTSADSDEFADLRQALGTLQEKVTSSPEIARADSEWAACMTTAGYSFTNPQGAITSLSQQWMELLGDGSTQPDASAKEKFKTEEIETALADLDCRTKTGYDERVEKVQWAAEEKFVADHRSELDKAKAAAEQGNS
ncbi:MULTISPECIES: hypothetical protein [Microbacterium]|uniref:Uncharacterized protein n=1 Tax=Microbacterium mcarthurae TaxID=3035918 RepID=A0ABW9GIP3_9MICO